MLPELSRRQDANDVQRLETWASAWAGAPIRQDDLVDEPRALRDGPSWTAPWRMIPPWTVIPHLAHAVARGKSRREVQEWYEDYCMFQQMRWVSNRNTDITDYLVPPISIPELSRNFQ